MTSADRFTKEQRSRVMSAVRQRDTQPELLLRRALHAAGLRYRLHGADLPGRPDIVFSRRKAAIFVHGCFWHGHGCKRSKLPQANREYWAEKIQRNVDRDARMISMLSADDWRVAVVWECALRGPHALPMAQIVRMISTWLARVRRSTLDVQGRSVRETE
ncbi:very short patch repair endonuclease [Roseiterribacter gracilis]|uniref:very short patch repair endonuclease n=1 Tax=Roseiterribacter gracilis TaxID=2812848 RepID=UPI003B439EE9